MSIVVTPQPAGSDFSRALVTGAAGFKGRWLMDLLAQEGVSPLGWDLRPPVDPGLHTWELVDLREPFSVPDDVDVVFHLAAQALVPAGYEDPRGTWETNVMTTVNLLEAVRERTSPLTVVIVTSDKVYRLPAEPRPLSEDDELGGYCPYSSSKAACELVAQSYRSLLPSAVRVATARAGNVIGGADFASGRLVPDIVRSAQRGEPVELRRPESTRPWLFVLDCLWGYLTLARRLSQGLPIPDAVNFGPSGSPWTAREVASFLAEQLDAPLPVVGPDSLFDEIPYLQLSTDLAQERLQWMPKLSTAEALGWTAEWAASWLTDADTARTVVDDQIRRYTRLILTAPGV